MTDDSMLSELRLNRRTLHMLYRSGLFEVGDVTSRSAADLLVLPDIGTSTVAHLRRVLDVHGLHLAGDVPRGGAL